jgi:tRNA(Arg) A34 adenosine deaminase TadA
MNNKDRKYILKAIKVAKKGIKKGEGGPFGAVIVKDGKVISSSCNKIYTEKDATAHAEIMAIRKAGKKLGQHKLDGATLYASCEPCPMCFSAAFYAGIKRVVFAARHKDAEEISGFGVKEIYAELSVGPMHRSMTHIQMEHEKGLEPFRLWEASK